ncbi:hypothetical protein [Solidesulfovibrio fructosivorans]|uniref:hypothetical protein n=1 Tax=Solidesulfovibrio fructosivorans TaxID=878 RepID=UPI00117E5088|nr:hypothetical protein [Solidesulfovibrio fructosivorans]
MQPNVNITELEIKAGLSLAGYSIAGLAHDLGVSTAHIHNVIKGNSKSRKISNAIREKAKRVKIIVIDD